jgi:hypothetical protein
MWFQNDLIDHKIGVHDKNQFEMKLDYTVHPDRRVNHYRTNVWFFIPKSLGINTHTYSREQFYADTQAYIRFKTPRQTFQSLLDPQNKRSPLIRVKALVNRHQNDPKSAEAKERIIYELRMLGAVVRSEARDQTWLIAQKLEKACTTSGRGTMEQTDACALWDRMLGDIEPILDSLRELRPTLLAAGFPDEVVEAYEFVDEFISISLELYMARVIKLSRNDERVRATVDRPYQRARQRIALERAHRIHAGYPSIVRPDGANEEYIYRRGVLKKFVTGVLFLNMRIEREGARLAQFVAAVAAGVAMFIALVATILTQRHYAIDSMAFVAFAVLTYMVKDRVKDGLRLYFFDKIGGTLPDHRVRIIDPVTRRVIGDCRESMTFLNSDKVPRDVVTLRNRTSLSVIESEGKPEHVIRYRKDVSIYTDRVLGEKRRVSDINDIIRFNVAHFLTHMDDPIVPIHYYDTDLDELVEVQGRKVYHVNVVFGFEGDAQEEVRTMHRLRVIIDKSGIRDLHLM